MGACRISGGDVCTDEYERMAGASAHARQHQVHRRALFVQDTQREDYARVRVPFSLPTALLGEGTLGSHVRSTTIVFSDSNCNGGVWRVAGAC